MGYGAPVAAPVHRGGAGFALIVVLFILLIIVGAAWYPRA
ncbi:YjcZ family sporulation protein [Anaerobacillus sp. CMMVII]|nr:YjcZ family sporulation protein [Anaerobacillus sp. CMMVII]